MALTWKKVKPLGATLAGATVGAGGVEYRADTDGFYRVPQEVAKELVHHGYILLEDVEAPNPGAPNVIDVARMSRDAMIDFCELNKIKTPAGRVKDSVLRALVINFIAGDIESEEDKVAEGEVEGEEGEDKKSKGKGKDKK